MKEKQLFFNPFRLISPKLNAEASRLDEIYESRPQEMTCLEEGLLVMLKKLHTMADLLYKCLLMGDPEKMGNCATLMEEIREEEKALTNALVCSPMTTGEVLKTVLLFPAKLERAGEALAEILDIAKRKAADGIPFSDKANDELKRLFDLLCEVLKNFKDLLATLNPSLIDILIAQEKELAQMTVDFALAHEERLIDGFCVPKASALYMGILDSAKGVDEYILNMTESLQKISTKY